MAVCGGNVSDVNLATILWSVYSRQHAGAYAVHYQGFVLSHPSMGLTKQRGFVRKEPWFMYAGYMRSQAGDRHFGPT